MILRRTSRFPKANVPFPRLLNWDSRRSQTCHRHSQVLPEVSSALPGAPKVLTCTLRCSSTCHNHYPGTPVPVTRNPSYSEGRQVCHFRVCYFSEIEVSKFTLHILSDTPGVILWLKYILLLMASKGSTEASITVTFTASIENYWLVASTSNLFV
jgi:hypothetical protein